MRNFCEDVFLRERDALFLLLLANLALSHRWALAQLIVPSSSALLGEMILALTWNYPLALDHNYNSFPGFLPWFPACCWGKNNLAFLLACLGLADDSSGIFCHMSRQAASSGFRQKEDQHWTTAFRQHLVPLATFSICGVPLSLSLPCSCRDPSQRRRKKSRCLESVDPTAGHNPSPASDRHGAVRGRPQRLEPIGG